MGNLQRLHHLIFADGRSRAAPPTLPIGSTSYCMRSKTCEMACESHMMEATVGGYHVYKEIWCTAEVIDDLLSDQLIEQAIMMAMPPANYTYMYLGHENLHAGIYFVGLIFMVCQSTVKTTKIGTRKNFPLYGIVSHIMYLFSCL